MIPTIPEGMARGIGIGDSKARVVVEHVVPVPELL
jgi:hypothetical protein